MKINDIIITNQDIKNEASYLKALNKELEKLDNKSILIIAKESIAREVIKKIELTEASYCQPLMNLVLPKRNL